LIDCFDLSRLILLLWSRGRDQATVLRPDVSIEKGIAPSSQPHTERNRAEDWKSSEKTQPWI